MKLRHAQPLLDAGHTLEVKDAGMDGYIAAFIAQEIEKQLAKENKERVGGRPKQEKPPTILLEVKEPSYQRESAHPKKGVN